MDIATLGVKIDPSAANSGANKVQQDLKSIGNTARTELGKLDTAATKAGSSTKKMASDSGGAFARMRGGLADMAKQALVFGAAAGIMTAGTTLFYQTINKTKEFQQLNAQLETATGSATGARTAFAALKKVAAETPFDLAQVTTSFTKMVNYGLEPSRRALMAYGDTASSMGKSLDQMVEAVADAATGEFERLKEFGIKAKNQGDKITFTFRGVKETVANNAQAIEGYLIKLGQKNFAGGMERQMKTLGGAFSNFGDAWDVMLATVGEKGLGELVESTVRKATESISNFTNYINSGGFAVAMAAIEQKIQGQAIQWQSLGQTIGLAFNNGAAFMRDFVNKASSDSEAWDGYWKNVFTNFPSNIEFMFRLSGIYMAGFVAKARQAAADILDAFSSGKFGDFLTDSLSDAMSYGASPEAKQRLEEMKQERQDARRLAESDAVKAAALAQGFSPLGGGAPAGVTIEEQVQADIDALVRENDAIRQNVEAYNARAQAIYDLSPGGPLFNGPPKLDGYGVLPPIGAIPGADPLAQFQVKPPPGLADIDVSGAKKAKVVKESEDTIKKAEVVQTAMTRLIDEWGNLNTLADQTMAGIANSIADNMTGALVGLINGTKSAKQAFNEMATSIINDILQMIIKMTIQLALSKALGGYSMAGAGAGAGSVGHSGGTVGQNLNSIPTFHSGGTLSSEKLVKADRGETILTRKRSSELESELRANRADRGQKQKGENTATIINVLDRNEIADAVARSPGAVVNALSRSLPQVRQMILSGQRP